MVTTTRALRGQPAAPPPATSRPRRRSRIGRVSRAAALTWLAASLAFVLSASVLRDRAERVEVLVAARDIPAGAELTAAMVRRISLDAHSPLATSFVLSAALRPGMIVRGVITEGSAIRAADLAAAGDGDRLRSMSIQVDRAQAVGGNLVVGDRIDVIHVVGGKPTYVVAGVQVIDVASSGTTGRLSRGGAAGGFFVVVRVDANQALALASAMDDGGVQIVRSTGAEPVADGTTSPQASR